MKHIGQVRMSFCDEGDCTKPPRRHAVNDCLKRRQRGEGYDGKVTDMWTQYHVQWWERGDTNPCLRSQKFLLNRETLGQRKGM